MSVTLRDADQHFLECEHLWVLQDSGYARYEFTPQEGAPGYGSIILSGYSKIWYCQRCRWVIEESTQ